MNFLSKSIPLWLITISVFILLFVPYLFSDGMFMDGLLYATVARNLAERPDFVSGLFHLTYTDTLLKEFYDQPPMAFWLQAVLFRLFGDSMYVERFYSLFTGLFCMVMILKIWRLIYRDNEAGKNVSWLPVFYWSIIPLVFWSYSNNMLENTLAMFALLSVYLMFYGLENGKHAEIYAGSSVCVLLAFLSKGFVGMFPLATIPIYWAVKRNTPFVSILKVYVVFLVCTVLVFSLFFSFEASREFFRHNFNAQVIPAIQGKLNTVSDNRLHNFWRILRELIPLFVFSLAFWGVSRRNQLVAFAPLQKEWFFIMLLIAISASFPIMLSYKQRGYYLVPSFPYYAIALAILVQPMVDSAMRLLYEKKSAYKAVSIFSVFFIVFALMFSASHIGKTRRDADRLTDAKLVSEYIKPLRLLSIHQSLKEDWNLFGYFARNHKVSLNWYEMTNFYLAEKGCEVPDSYTAVMLPTVKHQLFQKKVSP